MKLLQTNLQTVVFEFCFDIPLPLLLLFFHSLLKHKDLKSDITFLLDKHRLQKQHYYVCVTYVGRLHVILCSAFSVSTCSCSWSFYRNLTVATVVSHVL